MHRSDAINIVLLEDLIEKYDLFCAKQARKIRFAEIKEKSMKLKFLIAPNISKKMPGVSFHSNNIRVTCNSSFKERKF